jgi:hypothetical protein
MMSSEVYRQALVAAVLRRHRSSWSWARLGPACRCGGDLPCPVRAAALRALERR